MTTLKNMRKKKTESNLREFFLRKKRVGPLPLDRLSFFFLLSLPQFTVRNLDGVRGTKASFRGVELNLPR